MPWVSGYYRCAYPQPGHLSAHDRKRGEGVDIRKLGDPEVQPRPVRVKSRFDQLVDRIARSACNPNMDAYSHEVMLRHSARLDTGCVGAVTSPM